MARFARVRGWLECRHEQTPALRARATMWSARGAEYHLAPEQAELYVRGWAYPEAALNYTSLVFYGAEVRAPALAFVRAMITDVAHAPFAESENDAPDGMFFVDDDEGGPPRLWRITEGRLLDDAWPTEVA